MIPSASVHGDRIRRAVDDEFTVPAQHRGKRINHDPREGLLPEHQATITPGDTVGGIGDGPDRNRSGGGDLSFLVRNQRASLG